MKGFFVNCPNCKKHVITEAYLPNRAKFRVRCAHCGEDVDILVMGTTVRVKLLIKTPALTDEDEDDIIWLNL